MAVMTKTVVVLTFSSRMFYMCPDDFTYEASDGTTKGMFLLYIPANYMVVVRYIIVVVGFNELHTPA